MFTVIWLIVFTVLLPVQILTLHHFFSDSKTLFIAFMLHVISLYTSSIVAVVWVSVIKRKRFLEIIENISKVDNKIRYTPQEETYMNRKVFINIISEIILAIVIDCALISQNIYENAGERYYHIFLFIIPYFPEICNTLFLFQFVNLVFIVNQRHSHLNKRLCNWIIVTISRQISLMEENEWCIRQDVSIDHVYITPVSVSSVGNTEGTLKQTDIRSLQKIYSELFDITCLINDTYGVPILAIMCWMLTGVVCSLFRVLTDFNTWAVSDAVCVIMYSVLLFNLTLFCHTAENEARFSRILVQKLLIEGNFRKECVDLLKMFSLQLQVMTIDYTAGGFFTLNLKLFASVVSLIASYIVIMVQVK
jgi:hypothetical protein